MVGTSTQDIDIKLFDAFNWNWLSPLALTGFFFYDFWIVKMCKLGYSGREKKKSKLSINSVINFDG